ncbi:MAG: aldo/keto reductase [Bacteroidota bacterium]
METRLFGNTDLRVSLIGFGAWAIGGPAMAAKTPIGWGEVNDEVSLKALRRAHELGVTFFDTADFYGLGHSEELIGRVFGNNARVVVATKVGHRLDDQGAIVLDYSKKHILRACERSLRRLRRDQIDLYQLHSARIPHFEQGECVEAMEKLRREGKVRHWGLSLNTFHPEAEAEFLMSRNLGHGFQLVLNIINQRALPLVKTASAKGYGIIARMPLQFGLLTGKITPGTSFPPNDHRSFRLTSEIIREVLNGLEELAPVESRHGLTKTSLALSYCASIPGVSTIIPGIRTPQQAEQNTAKIVQLTEEDLRVTKDLYERKFSAVVEMMEKRG